MKKLFRFAAALTFSALFMIQFSCSDDPVQIPDNSDPVAMINDDMEEATIIEDILDDVISDLEQLDFLKSAEGCPVITIDRPDSTRYPKIVTKDFGDSCVNDLGRVKSGKIIVTIYGPWLEEGSKRLVQFENYTHNGIAVTGEKVITCKGINEDGFYVHTIRGTINLEKPDGINVEREIHKRRLLIAGAGDKEVLNEWLVEGYVNVSRSDGVKFEMHIAEPLYKIQGCRWYQSGLKILNFTINENGTESNQNIHIDYGYEEGSDECDSYALRWVNNEEPEIINLKK